MWQTKNTVFWLDNIAMWSGLFGADILHAVKNRKQ